MCQAVILQAAAIECTFSVSADVQSWEDSATECAASIVPATLHASPIDQGSHPEGWHSHDEWHVGWSRRVTATHLGYVWIMTIMRRLLLPGVCSFCTAGDISLGAASLCCLPASLT